MCMCSPLPVVVAALMCAVCGAGRGEIRSVRPGTLAWWVAELYPPIITTLAPLLRRAQQLTLRVLRRGDHYFYAHYTGTKVRLCCGVVAEYYNVYITGAACIAAPIYLPPV